MSFFFGKPKGIVRKQGESAKRMLDKLQSFLEDEAGDVERMLCGFWKDQGDALTYQEIREVILAGELTKELLAAWRNDYSVLVSKKMDGIWKHAMEAGGGSPEILENVPFHFSVHKPGVVDWIRERGASFVTACTGEQQKAVQALLSKKMVEAHTVDELSRMIRPCIGLTEGQAKANARYYDHICSTMRKKHPKMKPESIRKKALEASMKYAERQHRQRAMTIAQTELAFAYNKGADEGVRQAQEKRLIGTVVKRWSTSGDMNVCSICQGLDGMEIGMDDEFDFKGRVLYEGQKQTPPAHPRCACAVQYIEVAQEDAMIDSPMKTGDQWIDDFIEDYDASLVDADGDEAMSTRLLISHDEVRYEKNENMNAAFSYNGERDVILYNPHASNANNYDMKFALTHENAHRVDCLYLHSWENKRFVQAMDSTESLIMSNLDGMKELLKNKEYVMDFAFNDLISSLTRGKANDMLYVGHTEEYLASDYRRSLEVFADIACIDMGNSSVKEELGGILKELYEAYKEVVAWGNLA